MTRQIEEGFAYPIPGWPQYGVTSDGRVRRLDTGRWLRPFPSKKGGYFRVVLSVGGKSKKHYVNQLVAKTFHGPRPSPRHDAAHNDGVNTNNHYSNIRWATHSENEQDKVAHGTSNRGERNRATKITDAQVEEMVALAKTLPRSKDGKRLGNGELKKLAARFGVSKQCIWFNITGRRTLAQPGAQP